MRHLNHQNPHHRNYGEDLIGKPDDTLKNFLTDPGEFDWVIKKIINEGPPPKQIRNAILLKELSELVKEVSLLTGRLPEPANGIEVESNEPADNDYTYPIRLSEEVFSGTRDIDELLEWIEEGPPHDVLCDILIIAAIRWMKEAISNNGETISHEK